MKDDLCDSLTVSFPLGGGLGVNDLLRCDFCLGSCECKPCVHYSHAGLAKSHPEENKHLVWNAAQILMDGKISWLSDMSSNNFVLRDGLSPVLPNHLPFSLSFSSVIMLSMSLPLQNLLVFVTQMSSSQSVLVGIVLSVVNCDGESSVSCRL